MAEQKVINLYYLEACVQIAEAAGVDVVMKNHEARFLLKQAKRAATLEAQRRTWASHINRLAIALMDGPDPGADTYEFAQGMQLMAIPFLEGQDNGNRCQYCGKYDCSCVRQTGRCLTRSTRNSKSYMTSGRWRKP